MFYKNVSLAFKPRFNMETAFEELEKLLPVRKSKSGKDATPSARALYNYLEVKTPFSTWLARRVEEYGFAEGQDFLTILLESTGGREATDAALTVDMAKELGMVERTEKGRTVRRYFIWAENKLRQVVEAPRPTLPTNYKEALVALLSEVEQKERLEQELALAQPAIDFTKQVAVSANTLSMGESAKWLKVKGMGRNILCKWLRDHGVFTTGNEPKQKYLAAGYFELKAQTFAAGTKEQRMGCTPRVTGRGIEWLQKRLKEDGANI